MVRLRRRSTVVSVLAFSAVAPWPQVFNRCGVKQRTEVLPQSLRVDSENAGEAFLRHFQRAPSLRPSPILDRQTRVGRQRSPRKQPQRSWSGEQGAAGRKIPKQILHRLPTTVTPVRCGTPSTWQQSACRAAAGPIRSHSASFLLRKISPASTCLPFVTAGVANKQTAAAGLLLGGGVSGI